jgi:hypothetical protein
MDENVVYTNDEVVKMANKIVDSFSNFSGGTLEYMLHITNLRDPLAMFHKWSSPHNPKGEYPVNIGLLTFKQKALVAEIIGNAVAARIKSKQSSPD